MVKNFLTIALRNMLKDKYYTIINLSGLVIGITGTLFVVLYVWNELSYDKFHHDYKNIYEVALTGKIGEQEINASSTSAPLAIAMAENIPGVEEVVRIWGRGRPVFRYEEKAFAEQEIMAADSNFFTFFDFKLIKGSPSQVLAEPNSIVLIEELASKYFGESDPIGKIIQVGNEKKAYKVTGVCEAPPQNSSIDFNAVISMSSYYSENPEFFQAWLSNSLFTFIRKNPNTTVESINSKIDELVKINVGPTLSQFIGVDFEQFLKGGGKYGYWIFPFEEVRLYSQLDDSVGQKGDISYVIIFSAVGLFILLIACINFMNLSTARSAGRSKEVGIRKTMGSYRSQMATQFILESVLYSALATVISLLLVFILLPEFNLLAGVELDMTPIFTWQFFAVFIGIMLFTGILAGSYPAFYLTAFSIVDVLKGNGRSSMKSGWVRSSLVVFQFVISIALIIGTTVVYQQLNFLQDKNLGFDKDHIVIVNHASRLGNAQNAYKDALDALPVFQSTSYTNNTFPGVNNTTVFKTAETEVDHIMGTYYADWDHLETMGFELVAGRYFSRDFPSDSNAVVINEATVAQIGWENPIGEEFIDNNSDGGSRRIKVIGVVKDFNFESLKDKVRPLIIQLSKEANSLMVRYTGSGKETIEELETQWNKVAGDEPFEYTFLDQEFDQLFKSEQRLGGLFSVLSGLAIFVACLGLFGLAAFMAEQRVKEIGIRKVMGASATNLTKLLTSEFVKLISIAFIIAIVPSWYFMSDWLNNFAYRIELHWWVFLLAGFASLSIAYLTVFYQALKAAHANPIDSLKYE